MVCASEGDLTRSCTQVGLCIENLTRLNSKCLLINDPYNKWLPVAIGREKRGNVDVNVDDTGLG